jgi:dienelactone hydrolase
MILAARALSLVAFLTLLSAAGASAQTVVDLPQGSHAVGFRVVQQFDHAREFKRRIDPATGQVVETERARPVQTLIWYPASAKGQPLRYADYMVTRLTEESFDLSPAALKAAAAGQQAALVGRLGSAGKALLDSRVLAQRDAPASAGKFPVVVYAPGSGGTADENADLFEYLASHGYVVIASTSMGAQVKGIDYSMAGAEPQIADIEFLVGYAHSLPYADTRHIAAMGWSWGGMANVFAAARDDRIGALISLDGTREPAITRLIDVRRLTVPWLYFARTPDTIPQLNRNEIDTTFSLLNEARYAHKHQLTLYAMQHTDFVSRKQHESNEADYGEYDKAEVRHAYNMVALYVRHFLDGYIKQQPDGLALLAKNPRENGATRHSIRAETQLSTQTPTTQAQLAAQLASEGFGHAMEAYNAALQRDSSFKLSQQELKSWGYRLLKLEKTFEAREIFKLWTGLHPQDWDAFDSLGEACEAVGDRAAALSNYRRSLELYPGNASAAARVKALAGP